MDISRPGVFAFLDSTSGAQSVDLARKVQRLGYSTLWIVEAAGRNSLSHAAWLLAKTDTLVVGTGVASVWARAASTMAAGAKTAAELAEGRFILGIGANHPRATAMRGLNYGKPLSYMREYLAGLKSALYQAPMPLIEPPIVIGALNPRMLELAGRESNGAITYFLPPAHTAKARAAIGPGKWVCAEQAAMLERDAAKARAAARTYMKRYLTFPVYLDNLRLHGFGDGDLANGGSDQLVDAVVAWGDERELHERLEAHRKAGANHVCILPLSSDGGLAPDERVIEALAPL